MPKYQQAGDVSYSPGPAVGGGTSLAVVGAYVLASELARRAAILFVGSRRANACCDLPSSKASGSPKLRDPTVL